MDNKKQLKEGLLNKIIDNFFNSLKRGVSDRYIDAAEREGVHPETIDLMRAIEKHSNLLKKSNK